ncbi:MAG: serine hydrolase domain-containing protein [Pseudomonadota bacterium]
MGKIIKLFGILIFSLLIAAAWFMWPIYGFFSHRGEAPMLPFGWVEIGDTVPAAGHASDPQFSAAGNKALEAMVLHRKTINAPGISAAVAVGGEIVWQGAAGFADIAEGRAATADMVLRVGSTSKAITATALARLVQQDEIDLDESIATYLGTLPNEAWASITPRMLASHMAGIPHYNSNDDNDGLMVSMKLNKAYDDIRDALDQFDESALRFEPGTDFEYSSLGTVLLGAVMSEALDKPYRDIIRDEVLLPAGASATIVAPRNMRGDNFATPYYTENDRHRPWRRVDLSHRLPGGGWASTSTDLVRIGSLWLDDEFISPATRDMFWEPQVLSNGEVNDQDYALGWRWRNWEIDGVGLARNANHGGVSRGGQSWLLVYPDYDMAIAYNMNGRTEEFRPFAELHDRLFTPFAQTINDISAERPAPPLEGVN